MELSTSNFTNFDAIFTFNNDFVQMLLLCRLN